MSHDHEHFRRLAAEARAAASLKDEPLRAEVAGELALAYAALARRHAAAETPDQEPPAIPLAE